MSMKYVLSALCFAVAGVCGSAHAVDIGSVKGVGDPDPFTVLAGQNGDQWGTSYQLSTLGTAPAGVTDTAFYDAGTHLKVELDIPSSTSFHDFVKFQVPSLSSTSTSATAFNLSVDSLVSLFTFFKVDLYQGLPTTFGSSAALGPGLTFTHPSGALPTMSGSFSETLSFNTDYYLYITGTTVASPTLMPRYDLVLVATAVPEPGTYVMLLAGLAAIGFVAKRRTS